MKYSIVSNHRIVQQFNSKEEAINAIDNYWSIMSIDKFRVVEN